MMSGKQRGFTLVEIVIALSLVTLIMLGLLGALRTLGNTAEAVNVVSDRSSDMMLINGFLRRILSEARNLPYRVQDQEGQDAMFAHYAEGDARRLRWIGNFPARHGLSGLHFFELEIEGREPEGTLVLRYLPYSGAVRVPDWPAAMTHVLVQGVAELDLAYQVQDSLETWHAKWPLDSSDATLPARVRIRLKVGERHWPDLVHAFSPL